MIEFAPWPKTPRLFRDVIITEKIDGTNAAVHVTKTTTENFYDPNAARGWAFSEEYGQEIGFNVGAQSRNRLITPDADNFGFAAWVAANADGLAATLGEGIHYGEWWGSGIQRGYGLTKGEKRFSLFNVNRYERLTADVPEDDDGAPLPEVPGLGVVPILYEGPFSTYIVNGVLDRLAETGSHAAPGFMRPEGVIVFHTAARSVFKALLEGDDKPKGAAA